MDHCYLLFLAEASTKLGSFVGVKDVGKKFFHLGRGNNFLFEFTPFRPKTNSPEWTSFLSVELVGELINFSAANEKSLFLSVSKRRNGPCILNRKPKAACVRSITVKNAYYKERH